MKPNRYNTPEGKVSLVKHAIQSLPRSDSGQSNQEKRKAHSYHVPRGNCAGRHRALTATIGWNHMTTEANANCNDDKLKARGETGYRIDCVSVMGTLTQLEGRGIIL